MERTPFGLTCIYCNMTFVNKRKLRAHCQTDPHKMVIMSDDDSDWFWRLPPRGFKSGNYALCEQWKDKNSCRYGAQCVQAHGDDELNEWKERVSLRRMRIQRARQHGLFVKSYTDDIHEKLFFATNPTALMNEKIDDVEDSCSGPLSVKITSKGDQYAWTFYVKTKKSLKAVALLQDTHRNHFFISSIFVKNGGIHLENYQEWIPPLTNTASMVAVDYKITVVFTADIYGTFSQSIVFDFCTEPLLVKHLFVDVIPQSNLEIREAISLSISKRCTSHSSTIINKVTKESWEKRLRSLYPCPRTSTSPSTVDEKKFTQQNYRNIMHQLLYMEELARYELLGQYNLIATHLLAHSYTLSSNGMAASAAKYAANGELFASLRLEKELSEHTCEGRLLLTYCSTVHLSMMNSTQHKSKVYEARIEDIGKNIVYLRLPPEMVQELRLAPALNFRAKVEFQLNRTPFCEWHYNVDMVSSLNMILPDTFSKPKIPRSPTRQWSRTFDPRLNAKQKEAITAITTPLSTTLPPILIIGPYGTGKTFTLAHAIKELIKDPKNRILLCTHSNSTADLYIEEYFDQWVEAGEEQAKPLRIYNPKCTVITVSPVIQKYCLIKSKDTIRFFTTPSINDIMEHQIIVVTLSTSVYLTKMALPRGYFTHILIDEAAQSIECETIAPLAVAHVTTRIVLAGDHMQLGPDIFSTLARERNLHVSLLERLHDNYPTQFPCKIMLCENYRTNDVIIQFTSESFYDQKQISSSNQWNHVVFFPFAFFTTRGEEIQDDNSTAFYNLSEVYEVVERVAELKENWPSVWGAFNKQSICVLTPYSVQVFLIRSELRKKQIHNVCVERVMNVHGRQFRAIILSTVHTRKTCTDDSEESKFDYGFLSNLELLNTAITRAQSLVTVVGDPIALCSFGRCSKMWERFIQICNEHGNLFGITWPQLKHHLNCIEMKYIFILNPLAQEFIPREDKEKILLSIKVLPPSVLSPTQTVVLPPFTPADFSFSTPTVFPDNYTAVTFNMVLPNNSHNPIAQEISLPIEPVCPPLMVTPIQVNWRQPPIEMRAQSQYSSLSPAFDPNVLNDPIYLLPHNVSLTDM